MAIAVLNSVRITSIAVMIALGIVSSSSAQAPTKFKIIFAATPTTFQLPHYVAMDMGWLEKAGLKIEEVYVAGDPNAVRGLISDSGDAVVAAGVGLLTAQQATIRGARIKVLGSWQPRVDYQVLVHDRIKDVKDLATARIGVAAMHGLTHRLPEMLMKKNGVDPSKANFVVIGGHDARMKAVVADKIDAALVGMMYAAQGVSANRECKVLSSIASDYPNFGFTYLIAREQELDDPAKRKALETYVRVAIIEGSRFIMKNPQRAAEIMQSRVKDVPLPLILGVITEMNRLNLWGTSGGMEPEFIEATSKIGFETGSLTRLMQPNEGIDRTLVEQALKDLGRR